MKYSFLGMALIMSGIIGIVFITMFQSITIDNETEYYVLKEAMGAAMLESIDMTCYRINSEVAKEETETTPFENKCGKTIKIVEQKFVENFTRRFAASISGDVKNYEIQFYDIIESPPKASVVIRGLTKEYSFGSDDTTSFNIVNSLSGILETDINGESMANYLKTGDCEDLETGVFVNE